MKLPPTPRHPTQLACPRCAARQIGVRDTVVKGHRIIERYRFCAACHHLFKTREMIVSDYQEYEKTASGETLS